MSQFERNRVMDNVKSGKIGVLVATDVAARGIDVDDLAMVINYDLPVEAENYVHRIGRTARAGKSGKAYTFCSEQDVYNLPAIERYVEMSIPSSVAYPEQMEEDKSAGVYIKTENWHGDDENESRGGYKKAGKYSSGKGNGSYKGKGGKSYNRDDKGYKNGDYKKGGKGGKGGSYKKYDDKGKAAAYRKPSIDTEKLANLSYEERMKMYKETYGKSFAKGAKNNSNYKNKSKGNYNSKNKNYNQKQNVQKNTLASKKSLWQKIKEFFNK